MSQTPEEHILHLAQAGLPFTQIAAFTGYSPEDITAVLKDPSAPVTDPSAPPPPTPPASPGAGQDWVDQTANRARGQWYQLDAEKSVAINWTFINNSNAAVDIDIRYADDPAHWQQAVYVTPASLHMAAENDQASFQTIIPAGKYVQAIGTSGANFEKALELKL